MQIVYGITKGPPPHAKTHEKTSRKPVLPLLFTPPSRKGPHRVRNRHRLLNPIRYNRRNLSQPTPEKHNRYILFPRNAAKAMQSAATPKFIVPRLGALLRSHLPHAHASSLSATVTCGDVLWKTQAHVLSSSKRFFRCIDCIIQEVLYFVKRFCCSFPLSLYSLPRHIFSSATNRSPDSSPPRPCNGQSCSELRYSPVPFIIGFRYRRNSFRLP